MRRYPIQHGQWPGQKAQSQSKEEQQGNNAHPTHIGIGSMDMAAKLFGRAHVDRKGGAKNHKQCEEGQRRSEGSPFVVSSDPKKRWTSPRGLPEPYDQVNENRC